MPSDSAGLGERSIEAMVPRAHAWGTRWLPLALLLILLLLPTVPALLLVPLLALLTPLAAPLRMLVLVLLMWGLWACHPAGDCAAQDGKYAAVRFTLLGPELGFSATVHPAEAGCAGAILAHKAAEILGPASVGSVRREKVGRAMSSCLAAATQQGPCCCKRAPDPGPIEHRGLSLMLTACEPASVCCPIARPRAEGASWHPCASCGGPQGCPGDQGVCSLRHMPFSTSP